MAAGTIPISMTQQLDIYGAPLAGGQLYIIQAGTVSTPQDAFQDVALTIKQPYPMTLDAAGRVPQFFLDNSVNATVKIRLQDKNGVVQLAADNILIIGPAGGTGGGGTTVDPNALIQTGNIILRYGVGILAGYVRCNNLTIGSATSGATERANADCQALFQELWNADSSLVVTPGPRTTASGDWTANKQLTLPDFRGVIPAGMDDMGNVNALRLNGILPSTTLGGFGGVQSLNLAQGQLPNVAPAFSGTPVTLTSALSIDSVVTGLISGPQTSQTGGGTGTATGTGFGTNHGVTASTSYTPAGGVGSINGGVGQFPVPVAQPTRVCTIYLKL